MCELCILQYIKALQYHDWLHSALALLLLLLLVVVVVYVTMLHAELHYQVAYGWKKHPAASNPQQTYTCLWLLLFME